MHGSPHYDRYAPNPITATHVVASLVLLGVGVGAAWRGSQIRTSVANVPVPPGPSPAPPKPRPKPKADESDSTPPPEEETAEQEDKDPSGGYSEARHRFQVRLRGLGYPSPDDGYNSPAFQLQIKSFQRDVKAIQSTVMGLDPQADFLVREYGVMDVDGVRGPQSYGWLAWAEANRQMFESAVISRTGHQPGRG